MGTLLRYYGQKVTKWQIDQSEDSHFATGIYHQPDAMAKRVCWYVTFKLIIFHTLSRVYD